MDKFIESMIDHIVISKFQNNSTHRYPMTFAPVTGLVEMCYANSNKIHFKLNYPMISRHPFQPMSSWQRISDVTQRENWIQGERIDDTPLHPVRYYQKCCADNWNQQPINHGKVNASMSVAHISPRPCSFRLGIILPSIDTPRGHQSNYFDLICINRSTQNREEDPRHGHWSLIWLGCSTSYYGLLKPLLAMNNN
jgi:hypothetical protein